MKHNVVFFALAAVLPGYGQALRVESIANPATQGSLQANWSTAQDGSPLLSWVEKAQDGSYTLKYAIRHGAAWSEAHTVAARRRFFRHPAELPELIVLGDGTLVAHWIEMPNESSDAEYAYVSASHDGVKWSMPVMAHKDRSAVQHGLASMVASGDHEASLLWLEALKGEDGPTALKRTVVNAEGAVVKEESLDPDVCGCCPTSVVKTAKGLLVAYRAHTHEDIRDIAIIRLENGRWSPSKILNPDKWKIDACPTNAASASARADRVAVSWYTAAQDSPRVFMEFSMDDGATFGKPVLVSTGHSYGYTSTVLDNSAPGNEGAFVSWLEEGGGAARILARRVTAAGVVGPVIQVAQGTKQSLGYPRLLQAGNETWIAWGSPSGDARIQTARLVK